MIGVAPAAAVAPMIGDSARADVAAAIDVDAMAEYAGCPECGCFND